LRPQDRLVSRLRDIIVYGERAKRTIGGKKLSEITDVEDDALCYLVLIVTEAAVQAVALDGEIVRRHADIPRHGIRGTGNRLRHGYASLDRRVIHDVVANRHLDRLLDVAREELHRLTGD